MENDHELLRRLSAEQREKLHAYATLLRELNQKINLISREDEAHVEDHHIRHCLALTLKDFPPGSVVVDWGTGGGLPAIPLAVVFPDVTFHAVDAIDKKIRAVRTMARRLGLDNLEAWHVRAESWEGRAHFSVSRATAPLADLWSWHVHARARGAPAGAEAKTWRPGLICLKGGDLEEEIAELRARYPSVLVREQTLARVLPQPYFAEKCVLELFEEEPSAA